MDAGDERLDPDTRERFHEEQVAENYRALAPVIAELRAAGFPVATLEDLRRGGRAFKDAVPILVHWLPRVTRPGAKEALVGCLSYPWAMGAPAQSLIAEYHRVPKSEHSLRWTIGSAVEVLAESALAPQILEIVRDPSNGESRQMFVMALGKLPGLGVEPTLISLLQDRDVVAHAAYALGRLRATDAIPALETLLEDSRKLVRREAAKALKRITGKPPSPRTRQQK